MPFQKGNTIGQETRFKKGQVANPAGQPPDKLRRFLNAELEKIGREATDKKRFQSIASPLDSNGTPGGIRRVATLLSRTHVCAA